MRQTSISTFWTHWLLAVTVLGVGVGIVLFATTLIQSAVGGFYYEAFLGTGTYSALEEAPLRFQQFLYGVMGAIMAAWMLALAFIIHIPFRNGEKWAWYAVDASLVLWFIGDSYVSVITGFDVHVLINLALLIMMSLPLVMTFRRFHPRSTQTRYAEARS